MKLEPHLPQLPSIGELLEHPRVKGVVARINRSTIAQRATGFLEELRSSLAGRTGRAEIPSVAHLAERLARRLLGEPLAAGPVINATGVVVGDPELLPPLADAAVHAAMQMASEYHGAAAPLRESAERVLCESTGAEAALVVGNFDAALTLGMAGAAGNREVLVCGGGDSRASAIDWRWLASRSGAVLRTCAGSAEALAAAASNGTTLAAIIRAPEADGVVSLEQLSAVARARGVCLIDAAPLAGLLNPAAYGFQSTDTLAERLAAGADLVVAGAGLIGGPTCGVLLGRRGQVASAADHPLASLVALDAIAAAGLHATLGIYRDDKDQSAAFTIPVWQLLSAPLANLEQRAVRLAALVAENATVASAEPREVESAWRRSCAPTAVAKSWVIAVRPRTGDAAALVARLRHGAHPIAAREVEGAVHLDLRSVFPRWDQQLVAAFEVD